jgi:hypothetical protein
MRTSTLRVATVLGVVLGLSPGIAHDQVSSRRSRFPDLQPPEIVLRAPALAENFQFMVTAVVRDPSGVSKVFLSVDGEIVAGRTDSPAFHVFWVETRSRAMEVCVVADDRFGNSGRKCAEVEVPVLCSSGEDCAQTEYCAHEEIGDCVGPGVCLAFDPDSTCVLLYDPVCGCDGATYNNTCEARSRHGVNIAHRGACEDGPPDP